MSVSTSIQSDLRRFVKKRLKLLRELAIDIQRDERSKENNAMPAGIVRAEWLDVEKRIIDPRLVSTIT
jgi:hypothetical protein